MGPYLVRRALLIVLTLFGASVLVFSLIHLIPGDLVTILLGISASQGDATREALMRSLNLDKPLYQQYLLWAGGALQGDLGNSLVNGLSVTGQLARSFPVTLQLLVMAFVLAILIGVPAGAVAALRPNRGFDGFIRLFSLVFISTPAFFIGILLVLLSSFVPALPTLFYVPLSEDVGRSLYTMLLPSIALGLAVASIVLRFTRTAMLEVLSKDYVRTAKAKGLLGRTVVFRHALRNASVPIIAVLGAQFIQLMGNMIVIEQVFSLPGVGQVLVNAIYQKDYTTLQGIVMALITFSLVLSLLIDVLFAAVDPRIRYS